MQKGENIIYANHIIPGQIITAANSPDDIEPYQHVENEVKLVRPLYNEQTDWRVFRTSKKPHLHQRSWRGRREFFLTMLFLKISRKSYM